MNESILLEALKEIHEAYLKGWPTTVDVTMNEIATEAIKKWEDSSGKEADWKMIDIASEALAKEPDDEVWKFINTIRHTLWEFTLGTDGAEPETEFSKYIVSKSKEILAQCPDTITMVAKEDEGKETLLFDFCQSYCNSIYNINLCVEKQRIEFIQQFLKINPKEDTGKEDQLK